jgi:ubiquinone/menaquinone biosynthesis C-methylase UbiE
MPLPRPRLALAARHRHKTPVEPAEYALMDAAEDGMWWYRAAHARVLDALLARPGPAGPVLDAGCGTGGFLRRLAEALPGRATIGLDYVPEAAARAGRKSGAPVTVGDANRLPFGDAGFAALVSIDVLSHTGVDPAQSLAEAWRVLVPGGTIIANLPAFEWMRSAHDARVHNARRFTAAEVRHLLETAGFTDVVTRYWNSLLFPLMVLQRKVLSRSPDAPSDVTRYSPWIDRTLHTVSETERKIARLGIPMPIGGSILVVATRP